MFRKQIKKTFSLDYINRVGGGLQKTATMASYSGVSVSTNATQDEDEDDADQEEEEEKKEEDGDDGEAEEEARVNEQGEDESEDNVEEVDQREINNNWIKALDRNYPLKTYYKALKKNLLILLDSERIDSRTYPTWSENLFETFHNLA